VSKIYIILTEEEWERVKDIEEIRRGRLRYVNMAKDKLNKANFRSGLSRKKTAYIRAVEGTIALLKEGKKPSASSLKRVTGGLKWELGREFLEKYFWVVDEWVKGKYKSYSKINPNDWEMVKLKEKLLEKVEEDFSDDIT
jgi:hypothetical protein